MAESIHDRDIAIIGMAGRFPGASDLRMFWDNLRRGLSSMVELDDDTLRAAGVSEEHIANPAYVKRKPILAGTELFDAGFFGFLPGEAALLDPGHRLFLECAWEALEDAGHAADPGRHVGVYAGASVSTYFLRNLLQNRRIRESLEMNQLVYATDKDHLATRVGYKLDLRGPCVSINTACSTSLVAVHMACRALLGYQCDLALAGGAAVFVPQEEGYMYQDGGMASPDGLCRAFDAGARGTVFGSGVGVVALVRYEDAVRMGDTIYALIRGSAVNNDGAAKVGYTAPSVEGQAEVIAEAQAVADVDPATITYIEAHGTGTQLGDPIEMRALRHAFGDIPDRQNYCAIASVKTNIGHLDAVSGIAGLIKTALALNRREIPASLGYEQPNPEIDLASGPFFVNTELRPWTTDGAPRRAGVSSFGIGGTNAHVVLEEAPERERSSPSPRPAEIVLVSAKSRDAMVRASSNLASSLGKEPDRSLADVAFTLACGRKHFEHRAAVVAKDISEAVQGLLAIDTSAPARAAWIGHVASGALPVVFMFPGQGAQHVGMGRGLYQAQPVFRSALDRAAALFRPLLDQDLREILYPDEVRTEWAREAIDRTAYTQPALFAVEYALAELWRSWGIVPVALIGHSIGEYVAACVAGVLSLEDAVKVVARRGQLMQDMPGGAMIAVPLSEDELRSFLGADIAMAALNAPGRSVLAGPTQAMDALVKELAGHGIEAVWLRTSHAFHSSMMEPALQPFRELMATIQLAPPEIPYLSNVTGQWIRAEEATDPDYYATHLRAAVRFDQGIETLMSQRVHAFLEVGPGQTLCGLASARASGAPLIPSLPGRPGNYDEQSEMLHLFGAAARLWCAGVDMDWAGFYQDERRARLSLPTYPFERQRYWIEPDEVASLAPAAAQPESRGESLDLAASGAALRKPEIEPRFGSSSESLLDRVMALISEASGIPITRLQPGESFLALGLDSLTLIQLNRGLKARFQVDIPFRRLFDEFPTAEALTRHLHEIVPAAVLDAGAVQSRAAHRPEPAPVRAPAAPAEGRGRESGGSRAAHGPIRPANTAQDSGLTSTQRAHIDALALRSARRAPTSRKLAQNYRSVLADPRVPAGFSRVWKELVYPLSVARASGGRVWDVDGNEYVDLIMGFGVHFFGHAPEFVNVAVREALDHDEQMVGPHGEGVGEVARLLCELTGVERVSFCNTGSEAVSAALRLARTATDRDRIALFAGSYHGNFDTVLVRPVGGRTVPVSLGIPQHVAEDVLVLDYDSDEALDILSRRGHEIAAVLVEPVQCRHPDVQPRTFLERLRQVTRDTGTVLIFDEVVTGFRVHPGGARAWFGIDADLVTYGKVLGGGMPIGAVAGKAVYMDAIDGGMWSYGDDSFPPADQTAFAGTFCKHPLAMAAARAVLMHLSDRGPALQTGLARRTARLARDIGELLSARRVPIEIKQFSSIFLFSPGADFRWLDLFFFHMREQGISVWGERPYFLSTAHTENDLDAVCRAVERSVDALAEGGFLAPVQRGETRHRERGAPLTESQREVWVACQMGDDVSRAYNTVSALRLLGSLDVEALRAAVEGVIARHEALRSTFEQSGERQRFARRLEIMLPLRELSDLESAESEVRAVLDREAMMPFDLATGPLIRGELLALGPEEHVLVLTTHHIACDGLSMDVVLGDLMAGYLAEIGTPGPELSKPTPFSEYVAWERDLRESSAGKADLEYWRQRFAAGVPTLDLPLSQPRPRVLGAHGARARLVLEPELSAALKRVGAARGTTPFVTVLACFQALLARLSNPEQGYLIVGVPVAGQSLAGKRGLVGHCVNLLPVATSAEGELPFAEYLDQVKIAFLDAHEHGSVTLGTLVQALDLSRDPSRPPLCAVTFNLETPPSRLEFGGLTVESVPAPKPFVQFEIVCNALDTGAGLIIEWDYNTELFDCRTIEQWLHHLRCLIRGVVEDPGRALARLPLLTEAERTLLLARPAGSIEPRHDTIVEWFAARVREAPDAIAVSGVSAPSVNEQTADAVPEALTYAQVHAGARALARRLGNLGVAPGARVAVYMERTPRVVVALLGVLEAGAAYVPLDPTWPLERISYMMGDARVSALVTETGLGQAVAAMAAHRDLARVYMDDDSLEAEGEPGAALDVAVAVAPDQVAYVIYTSGSTGQPKGVAVTHRNVTRLLAATESLFDFGPSDVWTCTHSYAFDFSVWETFGALLHGGRVIVVPYWVAREPDALLRLIAEESVTVLDQTPSAFRQLIAADARLEPRDLALRLVIFGGEALDVASLRSWFERRGDARPRLVNMYGITETTVHVTHRLVTARDLDRPGSFIGLPIADLHIRILDPQGEPVPVGVPGEIHVGGAGLAQGYLFRPELTAERYIADSHGTAGARLYRTGDLGRWVPDSAGKGLEIEYLGRMDHQVQLRGFRVELGEIEARLGDHPSVREAVVVARDDQQGQRLIAYVASDVPLDRAALRSHLGQTLPEYMVPALFVPVDALPRTATGKLDRTALAEREPDDATALPGQHAPPRTDTEHALVNIWKAALGAPQVGIHDNFFELGGDSIINIQIVARARSVGLNFGPRDLFTYPTVAELARIVKHAPVAASAQAENLPAGPVPLTPIQRWFFTREDPEPHLYSQAAIVEVPAELDGQALRQSLEAIAAHHDAFRLCFERRADGAWEQRYTEIAAVGFVDIEIAAEKGGAIERDLAEATDLARAALDLARGPLLQARLVRARGVHGPRPDRLVLVAHHLVIDGVTWRILLEDLECAYRRAVSGEAIVLPPRTSSFGAWAHRLARYAATEDLSSELEFWLNQRGPGVSLVSEPGPVASAQAHASALRSRISGPIARALVRDLPERYHARADEVLLTAVALTLTRGQGASPSRARVLVDLEGHGREELFDGIDVTRTAGWFTTLFPVAVEVDREKPVDAAIKSVKEQVRAASGRASSYGVLRYMHPDDRVREQLAQASRAPVLFNYLGRLAADESQLFGVIKRAPGADQSSRARATHLLEIEALVTGSASEPILEIEWRHDPARLSADAVATLARELEIMLESLAEQGLAPGAGGYTPSDFPDADLTQDALDQVMAEIDRAEMERA